MIQEIDKSLTDYKHYRVISLENNIKVVLISDIKPVSSNYSNHSLIDENESNDIQKSAAALCINVGSFNDPVDCQGLAHFLEHMVFMGSKKYPNENDFDNSVSQHGGSCGAWTESERTLFYFDSHSKYFEILLDKFANFFIKPLLLKDSINRELAAIHSEFEYGYHDNFRRLECLLQSMSKPDSPYQIFQCGNLKSLKHDPKSRKLNIFEYLKEFQKNMYLSQWMTLAVQSRSDLNNLEKIVRHIFSKIPGNDINKPDISHLYKPFETNDFSRFYYVVPVDDVKSLKLVWSLPPLISHYKSKPLNILGHFIGHEGPGSLTAYLKKMNFILSQEAGNNNSGFDLSSINSFFTIYVTLTEYGFENITEIIRIIFSYIDLLKKEGVPISLFEEYKKAKYNDFLYRELDDPVQVVEYLAVNLQLYESQHILSGPYIANEYKPELYSEILSYMTPDKVNIMLLSLSNESMADKITEWYDVRHSVRDFSDSERNQWSSPSFIPDLHLPRENQYIASKFDLVEIVKFSDQVPRNLVNIEYPELGNYGEIWHLLDNKFRIPKAFSAVINFYLWSPFISESPLNACLTDFVLYIINEELNIVAYDAKIAGLKFDIIFQDSGIMIYIYGFSDKISLLFRTIIDILKNFTLAENKFLIYKESMRQNYRNMLLNIHCLAEFITKKIFYPEEFMLSERLNILKNVFLKDLVMFHRNMFRSMRIKSYFHGNLSTNEAKLCFMYCVDNLNFQSNKLISESFVRQISVGESRIGILNLNPKDKNTFINIIYQIGPGTIELEAVNEFLIHLLAEPCFNFLRTKETLGYSVGLVDSNIRGILGISLFVHSQANLFSTDHCINKMNIFFESVVLDVIEKLSYDDYNDFKSSFIANKSIEDLQMVDIESKNWTEILNEELVFNRNTKQVEFIENLSKSDLKNFFLDRYLNKLAERKLIIEVDAEENLNRNSMDDLFNIQLQYLEVEPGKGPMNINNIVSHMDIVSSHPIIT